MVDMASLERLDSFPYRHRVHEVMGSPVATAAQDTSIADACRRMADSGISSLIVADRENRPIGIVTERDVLRAVAAHRERAIGLPLSHVMSSPVATVRDDALLYVAMGRMDRLKLRHLVAVDRQGRATGMVTVRGLLHIRAGTALALGDEMMTADRTDQMALAKDRLPLLAHGLLAEGVDGTGIAAVTSSVLRDMTARCAELAERSMQDDDWGRAPAPWCVLLLGSGGRRESLFGADQDNAIIHAGDDPADAWFAELGRRMNRMLDGAGVPLCKGGVMAQNPQWRHSVDGWRAEITRWMKEADGEELLNISIFCDFRAVYGDTMLAETVRTELTEAAAHAPRFLHAMAGTVSRMGTALGVLGQFKTREGRLDLKLTGLLPLVSTVRLLALKHGVGVTGTIERLRALAAEGHMPQHEAERFVDGLELMLRILARQQVADLAETIPLSNRIDPKRMPEDERHRLKEAFRSLGALHWVLNNALSTA